MHLHPSDQHPSSQYLDQQLLDGLTSDQRPSSQHPSDPCSSHPSVRFVPLPTPAPLDVPAALGRLDARHTWLHARPESAKITYPPVHVAQPEVFTALSKVARDPFYDFAAKNYLRPVPLLTKLCGGRLSGQLVNYQHTDRLNDCFAMFTEQLGREQWRVDQEVMRGLGIGQGSVVQLIEVTRFHRRGNQYDLAVLLRSTAQLHLSDFDDRLYVLNPPNRRFTMKLRRARGAGVAASLRRALNDYYQRPPLNPLTLGCTVEYFLLTNHGVFGRSTGPVMAVWQLELDGERVICWAAHGPGDDTYVYALRYVACMPYVLAQFLNDAQSVGRVLSFSANASPLAVTRKPRAATQRPAIAAPAPPATPVASTAPATKSATALFATPSVTTGPVSD